MHRFSHKKAVFILFILAGVLLGMALPEVLYQEEDAYAGLFSLYSFQTFKQQEIHSIDMFRYLLHIRMKLLLFLWMSSFTPFGMLLHLSVVAWLSLSGGMLLSLLVIKTGYQGVLIFLCSLLPHWIFYFAMWKREAEGMLLRRSYSNGKNMLGALHEICGLSVLGVLGCVCESLVGIYVIKIFSEIFL